MKRISWNLPVFSLPDFKFYKTSDKIKRGQTPITINEEHETLPTNNSYFIGTSGGNKLLCYHISDGKYIVVSYNRNTEIIFKDIIDIYNKNDNDVHKGININTKSDSKVRAVSIINADGKVGEQDE